MRADHFSEDILDFFRCLSAHEVKYLVIGGEAVIYYGNPRLTGDIDFFFEAKTENVKKLFYSLLKFWDDNIPGLESYTELLEVGVIIQFGVPPNRIDLINKIDGVGFEEAWENREMVDLEFSDTKIKIPYIGLDQLIKNKQVADRLKDQEDLKYLVRAREM